MKLEHNDIREELEFLNSMFGFAIIGTVFFVVFAVSFIGKVDPLDCIMLLAPFIIGVYLATNLIVGLDNYVDYVYGMVSGKETTLTLLKLREYSMAVEKGILTDIAYITKNLRSATLFSVLLESKERVDFIADIEYDNEFQEYIFREVSILMLFATKSYLRKPRTLALYFPREDILLMNIPTSDINTFVGIFIINAIISPFILGILHEAPLPLKIIMVPLLMIPVFLQYKIYKRIKGAIRG